MMKKIKKIFCFICFAIFILFPNNNSLAAIFCVSTPAELQNALSVAGTNSQDDLIRVQEGTYIGNFIYSSTEAFGVKLEGGYSLGCATRVVDPTTTVLDAQGGGSVLVLIASNVAADFEVESLSIKNGYIPDRSGSGIYLNTQGNVFLLNNNFINNLGESPYRHAVDINFAKMVDLTGNTITDNHGGIDIVRSETVKIVNNTINGNNGDQGGGLRISQSNFVDIHNNIVNNNNSGNSSGGGMYIEADTVKLSGNYVQGNITSYYYGGAYIEADAINLFNNIISNNKSNSNHQPYWNGGGGGIHARASSEINLINNTIDSNDGGIGGGGIWLLLENDTTQAKIFNNIILNNIGNEGADIHIKNDTNTNYILSPVNLFNNNFDQSTAGTYIQTPFPIDPSNFNNVDPIFVDPSNGDYHLTAGSPCIDTGTSENAPIDDIDGDLRPQGAGYDIGADEYMSEISIDTIIDFFDESVADGTIYGSGKKPHIANLKLWLFSQTLKNAKYFIEKDEIEYACKALNRAFLRCDSDPWPIDFVEGEDVVELADMILELMDELGCQ